MLRVGMHFNTSNVTIQHCQKMLMLIQIQDFNTSNVTIQRLKLGLLNVILLHFNTSNVTIQQSTGSTRKSRNFISIHLMLLFNQRF